MDLEPIPAFEDNYIWTVHDGKSALFVDPGEAEPILSWLERRCMRPAAILVTHLHGDHCGGVPELLEHHDVPVYGPAHERIRGVDHPVSEGMACKVPELGVEFAVLDIPGHTAGHIGYLGHGWLFCGDTLFSCGCGKVFSGTVEQLHTSLSRIGALPAETLACCAHEYTLDNIRFALTIEPDNPGLAAWQSQATLDRRVGRPTLPVRLGDELARNPFLRCDLPEIRSRLAALAGFSAPIDAQKAFAVLRGLKDRFG